MPQYHVTTAVHKAYKMLEDEEQKGYIMEVLEDAKAMLDKKVHGIYSTRTIQSRCETLKAVNGFNEVQA